MENSPYWNQVTDERASRLGVEGTMDGAALISAETQEMERGSDLYSFARENFESFLAAARRLPSWDYELCICYFLLDKPQQTIARLFRTTQTMSSSDLTRIGATVVAHLMFGSLDSQRLASALEREGVSRPA